MNAFALNDDQNKEVPTKEIPDYINSFFSLIGPNLAKHFSERWVCHGPEIENVMPDLESNLEDIVKFIREISVYKASAVPNILSKMLKFAFLSTLQKLKKIFDCSLNTGKIPKSWKHALIIPLQKEVSTRDVNNLRPISLLPLPGKILEKIVQKTLTNYLETNNILDPNQGGFRPKHSTTDSAVKLTEDIYYGMNNKEYTSVVYVDLRKAFDTVNYNILIKKLGKIGIGNKLKKWFTDYLENRTQSTFAYNLTSEVLPQTCGVPQSSVLGPTLYLIYINDVKYVLDHVSHLLYADDTALYLRGQNLDVLENKLQSDLNKFSLWCKQNELTVNVKKTKYVLYGSSKMLKKARNLQFYIGESIFDREHYYKYLGLYFDSISILISI